MDTCPKGPYLHKGEVSRADVWRLRYDCHADYREIDDYSHTPLYGWPPFGKMREGRISSLSYRLILPARINGPTLIGHGATTVLKMLGF